MNYGVFCLKNKYDSLYCREIINGLVPCLLITNVPSTTKSNNIENYLINAQMGFNKFSYEHNCYQLLEQTMWPTDQPKFDKQIDYTQLVRQPGWQEEKIEMLDQSKQRDKVRSIIEDLGNGETIELAFIPGGTFLMGSPSVNKEVQHTTTISPFHLGKYQVTQAQWRAVAKLPRINRDLEPNPSHFQGNNLPVEQVSWEDCIEFCNRLSLKTGRTYFLPSEAQWEYACRAGTTTDFYFGEYISKKLVNYNNKKTTSVGTVGTPNAFGLYDVHGNVWEWCADTPTNSSDNSVRVLRGGCWFVLSSDTCSSTSYYNKRLDEKNRCCGFRVAYIHTTTNNQFSRSTSEQKQPKSNNNPIQHQSECGLSKGSPKFKVKSEFVPTRCEICHQSDCFDAIQNRCSRCSGSSEQSQPDPTRSRPTQVFSTNNLLFAVGGLCVVLLSLFFYQSYSSVSLERASKTNLPQNTTLNTVADKKQVSIVTALPDTKKELSSEKEMSLEEATSILEASLNEQTTHSNIAAKDDWAEFDKLVKQSEGKEIPAAQTNTTSSLNAPSLLTDALDPNSLFITPFPRPLYDKTGNIHTPFASNSPQETEYLVILQAHDEEYKSLRSKNSSTDELNKLYKKYQQQYNKLVSNSKLAERFASKLQLNNYSFESNNKPTTNSNNTTNTTTYGLVPSQPIDVSPARTSQSNIFTPTVVEKDNYYSQYSTNNVPKTVHVNGYYRKDGTYVKSHYRSSPRR